VFLIVYSLYLWPTGYFLLFTRALDNWQFVAALNILILAWSFWVLTRPKAMIFFRREE